LEGTLLAYQWAYLFRRARYYSPDLHAQHIIPSRLTLEDMSSKKEQKIFPSIPQNVSDNLDSIISKGCIVSFFSRCLFRIVTLMRRSQQFQAIERVSSDSARSSAADPLAFTSLVYPALEPPLFTLCSSRSLSPLQSNPSESFSISIRICLLLQMPRNLCS
jgi:hypothetical protein